MISCLKKTVWFLILVFGSKSSGLAQSAFFEVASTPYDRQMLRGRITFAGPIGHSIDRLSFALVNEWMIKLRAIAVSLFERMADAVGGGSRQSGRLQRQGDRPLRPKCN